MAFEQLKKRLSAEGLFAEARKKALPFLPASIGIVTSEKGAALRDMLRIIADRYPDRRIVVRPVRVQGEGAAKEIASGITELGESGHVDVMIVGRGGGSLEDLWAFNEEIVARSIFASPVPVISAVGHEIDFTIADFVADFRAPTPTAAAEIVVPQKVRIGGPGDGFGRTALADVCGGSWNWQKKIGVVSSRGWLTLNGSCVKPNAAWMSCPLTSCDDCEIACDGLGSH